MAAPSFEGIEFYPLAPDGISEEGGIEHSTRSMPNCTTFYRDIRGPKPKVITIQAYFESEDDRQLIAAKEGTVGVLKIPPSRTLTALLINTRASRLYENNSRLAELVFEVA
jgi:hypothetical protein